MQEILKTDIQFLKGIGPKRATCFYNMGVHTFDDLLNYFPRKYLDRREMKSIASLRNGEEVTVVVEVLRKDAPASSWKQKRFSIVVGDKSGVMKLTWFYGATYLEKKFEKGQMLAIFGKVNFFGREAQMTHPEIDFLSDKEPDAEQDEITTQPSLGKTDYDFFNTGGIVSLYSSSDEMKRVGLTTHGIRKSILHLIEKIKYEIPNSFPTTFIDRYKLLPLKNAYHEIHFPTTKEKLDQARLTLKWQELFFLQLLFSLRSAHTKKETSIYAFTNIGTNTSKVLAELPYSLTDAQKKVLREIQKDFASGMPMNRLLQGDVGSGKTIIGIISMLIAIDNGAQCAFMAPTEILATQHYIVLKKILQPYNISVELIIGKQSKKVREKILQATKEGTVSITVGTHALIEGDVAFANLGLVIIDEQHRFGVLQRKALQEKSHNPHILLMTATPIPRTLCLSVYGDLDVSILDQMPKDRKPIQTFLRHESEQTTIYEFIQSQLAKGHQAYIVYPLVDESEKIDLNSAILEYERLQRDVFANVRVGLIHGRLSAAEKEEAMEKFRKNETQVLVGTVVIEVGIDVPNATVIIVEHAERFGLAQLHQLRGRVGRGVAQSYCYLVYHKNVTLEAKERLYAMERTTDGFEISEIDMNLRGVGNILGTEQSGLVNALKISDLTKDKNILEKARMEAQELVRTDTQLRKEENKLVRIYYLNYYKKISGLLDVG